MCESPVAHHQRVCLYFFLDVVANEGGQKKHLLCTHKEVPMQCEETPEVTTICMLTYTYHTLSSSLSRTHARTSRDNIASLSVCLCAIFDTVNRHPLVSLRTPTERRKDCDDDVSVPRVLILLCDEERIRPSHVVIAASP